MSDDDIIPEHTKYDIMGIIRGAFEQGIRIGQIDGLIKEDVKALVDTYTKERTAAMSTRLRPVLIGLKREIPDDKD